MDNSYISIEPTTKTKATSTVEENQKEVYFVADKKKWIFVFKLMLKLVFI